MKAAQDLAHCFDVRAGETMYWVSDMGWMMGPWEVLGMTLLGGTFVIFDGALDYPDAGRLWRLVERHGLQVLVPCDEDRDVVHRVIYEELCLGVIEPASRAAYRRRESWLR